MRAINFASHNVAASFDFVHEFLGAKGAEEIVKLHAGFVGSQMHALTEHARELARQAAKAAGNSMSSGADLSH